MKSTIVQWKSTGDRKGDDMRTDTENGACEHCTYSIGQGMCCFSPNEFRPALKPESCGIDEYISKNIKGEHEHAIHES